MNRKGEMEKNLIHASLNTCTRKYALALLEMEFEIFNRIKPRVTWMTNANNPTSYSFSIGH